MVEESYCSLELCEKVKELRIEDLECRSFYIDIFGNGEWRLKHMSQEYFPSSEGYYITEFVIACPTHQVLKNWLRETHNIYVIDNEPVDYNHWYCTILWTDGEGVLHRENGDISENYNIAVDSALLKTLTKIKDYVQLEEKED